MISSEMAYVALVSSDVQSTCNVLGNILNLPLNEVPCATSGKKIPVFTVGKSALAVFEVGDRLVEGQEKPGVHHIALVAESLDQAESQLAKHGFSKIEKSKSPGLNDLPIYKIPKSETTGVQTWLTSKLHLKPHISGEIQRIDHLGIAVNDVNESEKIFSNKMGFEVESRQTDMEVSMAIESFTSDKYGVIYHNRDPQPIGGLRVCFITVGDCELEFLANFNPNQSVEMEHGRPGSTKQDQGAIAKFVSSRGQGLHHIALKSPNINATLDKLHKAGVALIDYVGRPGSRRAQIGFIHPKGLGGVLLHVVERA
jgi:catechol 2,3-dioxygenase-like lactoylglutathione lyase family enzyme